MDRAIEHMQKVLKDSRSSPSYNKNTQFKHFANAEEKRANS
jgi:hypothetical protein